MPFFWAAVASSWEPHVFPPLPQPVLFLSLSLLPTCLHLAGRVPGRRWLSLAPHCSEDCGRDIVMSPQGMWPEVSGDPPGRPGLGPPGIPGISLATGGGAVGYLL